MIGVSDKSWLIDLLSSVALDRANLVPEIAADNDKHIYSTYFGLGHQLKLHDRPGVFRVSLAGMALGSYLIKGLAHDELTGRLLDLGTGSGVLALLLRSLGAQDITASDVSTSAVGLALENEILNFHSTRIRFFSDDLFEGLPEGDRYDTVIFNPPGWRTPSEKCLDRLRRNADGVDMTPETMFYGDEVLLNFLKDLPDRMSRTGRAIVGLNSLVGIRDVLARYKAFYPTGAPLQFQLLERHSLPLLFYSPGWKRAEPFLREEFEQWRDAYGAAYTIDGQGRLYWSYEIVECKLVPTALG
jgi:release factor glutamine methyltransferase